MKSDDIKRSVRSLKHDRSAGDAPDIGRVARMPGTGLPKGERRKRRRSEGGKKSRIREGSRVVIATWSFLLAGTVLVVLGLIIWLWLIPNMRSRESETIGRFEPKEEVRTRVASKFPSPSEADALALVRRALAVREPEQIPGYFRIGSVAPQAVVDFLKGLDVVDGVIDRFDWLSSMDANGMQLDGVLVHFKGMGNPRNRVALLTPDEEGKWKIDFDAFARTVTPTWSELLEKKAPVAQVRIYAARDSYYNGLFSDEKVWTCFGIASPDADEILMAYCRKGSPQAAALEVIFSKERKLTRAILEIRRVEGAESRQFEISRVLADDWVMGPATFDESFK
ncbi:MAG: hypothetical protein V4584_04440 [Verrucomicrobiota bacterium]